MQGFAGAGLLGQDRPVWMHMRIGLGAPVADLVLSSGPSCQQPRSDPASVQKIPLRTLYNLPPCG